MPQNQDYLRACATLGIKPTENPHHRIERQTAQGFPRPIPKPRMYSVHEALTMIEQIIRRDWSRASIYRAIANHTLHHHRLGKQILIAPTQLATFIEEFLQPR
jgi:hypothetical protein